MSKISQQYVNRWLWNITWRDPGWYKEELVKLWQHAGSCKMSKWTKKSIIAVACPSQGEGTDPEALGLAFNHQGPTFISAYCQAATILVGSGQYGVFCLTQLQRATYLLNCIVMVQLARLSQSRGFICLCQGGVHSSSASSICIFVSFFLFLR